MKTTASKLAQRLQSAKSVNDQLSAVVIANGGGCVGVTATMFANASKDLAKAQRAVRNAYANGDITIAEYRELV